MPSVHREAGDVRYHDGVSPKDLADEIDRLYQQPLASFTRERDAAAKRLGSDGAILKRLEKPAVAAWAVNQVYWQDRQAFDRIAKAGVRLRQAHERQLGGQPVDIEIAEVAYRAALTAATHSARALLEHAGDAASEATLAAVRETFETLAWAPLDGRLIRPRRRTGLEALAALAKGPAPKAARTAEVVSMPAPPLPVRANKADLAKREADARNRRRAELARDLRSAAAEESKAQHAADRAAAEADRVMREQQRLEANLEKMATRVRALRARSAELHERLKGASATRSHLESQLDALKEEAVSH